MKQILIALLALTTSAIFASQSTLIWIGNGAPSIQEQIKTWEYKKQQCHATINTIIPTAKEDLHKHITTLDTKIQQLSRSIKKLQEDLLRHAQSKAAEDYSAWEAYCATQTEYEQEYLNELDQREQLLREKIQMEKILQGYLKNAK